MLMIGNEKLMFDELGNPFYRRITSNDGSYVDVQPENCQLPLLKELTIKIILKREGYNSQMQKQFWYGLQDITISISNEKALQYYYLVFDPKAMENVCCKIISPAIYDVFGNFNSITWTLSLNPLKESVESDWFKRGKPRTITFLKAKAMLASNQALCVLNDSGEELAE